MGEESRGHGGAEHGAEAGGGMGMRGVTRPMAMQEGEHGEGREERLGMLREHHGKTLWVYWSLVLLGVWMVASPLTFDYGAAPVEPSGGRELWLSLDLRVRALAWSDVLSGLLLIAFGWRSLTPARPVSLWICDRGRGGRHGAARQGEPFWRTFWKGGPGKTSEEDERSPEMLELPRHPARLLRASVWGMSIPWTLGASTAFGLWLMGSPALFGQEERAADVFHLGGALIVVVAVVAMGEPVRALRYLGVLLGSLVALVPWWVDGGTTAGLVNGSLAGVLVALLSLPRGRLRESYGTWDRFVV